MTKKRKKNPHAVALGRLGGLAKSAAKAAAVRENGKLGGRPPRTPRPQEAMHDAGANTKETPKWR
jgi:hypothetical protein